MKKSISFQIVFFALWLGLIGQSGSIAFAQSTTLATDGIYVPRMTSAQRDSINSPVNGQMIYNINHECFNVYQKDSWQKLCANNIQTIGIWSEKANFGGESRFGAVGFSIGNKGYIGTGKGISGKLKDFWEYDPATNVWAQKADFGGVERNAAVGFSINTKGYIGAGDGGNDFWEYDPAANTWVRKADVGGDGRKNAIGFSIDNKGYVGTGNYKKDFWEYNPAIDTWVQKADFGGLERSNAKGFSIGNKGYIGMGDYEESDRFKDFWEYNPTTDAWTQKADFIEESKWGFSFSIQKKGYVGGHTSTGHGLWEYDPIANVWIQKPGLPGEFLLNPIGFSIGNKGYIGTGLTLGGLNKEFLQYDPNGNIITQQGNVFNGTTQLVRTDDAGKIPASVLPLTATVQGNEFNGNTQLVQTNLLGKIPIDVLPVNITTQGNNFNQPNQLTKLDASGFLGIRVTSPKAFIHLPNSIKNRKLILWQESNNEHQFAGFGTNLKELRYQVEDIHASHVFYRGDGTNSSRELFRISGDGNAVLAGRLNSNGSSSSSDIRYKRNLSSIDNPLDKVLQMNGFYYFWKTEQFKEKNFPATRQIGFIAQEVEALFPELVDTDEKGYKSVDYTQLTPVLVEAIKELKRELMSVRKENNTVLEQSKNILKENASIRKDIEALKNLILQAQNGK